MVFGIVAVWLTLSPGGCASPARKTTETKGKDPEMAARLAKFLEETEARPEYGWFNREDLIYHDGYDTYVYPSEVESHPDFWVFSRRVAWVFNRAMEWQRNEKDGTILCYSRGSELILTGERQVSAWHSAPPNVLEQIGDVTRFVKHSGRQRDSAVLPAFQFHLGQNPDVELEVTEADADWQFCVSIKGRGGAPMLTSPWQRGAGKLSFDLQKELRKRGYDLQFPELHFAMGLWTPKPAVNAQIKFKLRMAGRAAVVTGLPVIRTVERAGKEGVPLAAAALSARGELLGTSRVRIFATLGKQRIALTENGGVWKTVLRNLPAGDHEVTVASEGEFKASAKAVVRVTDGRFFKYDKESRWVTRDGKPMGPLSGSFQGTFFFRDAGLPAERMVQGQKEWDAWDRTKAPGEHMHYWEALTPRELDDRISYCALNGYDLVHLHSHWGLWERLDAGGRIAPHGAEQLALYIRSANRHGLAHIQALSSGPYGRPQDPPAYGGTVPFSRYLEAGFKKEDWFKPGGKFNDMFHQYIRDFIALFRDETALLGMTASGEGDWRPALERTIDVFRYVRELDPNHIMLAEPIFATTALPENLCAGYPQDMLGGRTYDIGISILPEFDLGVEFKLYRTVDNVFMAEGSWPPMISYNRLHYEVLKNNWGGSKTCWTGTPMYRTRVRDTYYLGLVHRMAVMNLWDEEMAEDEHRILRTIRDQVDWSQRFSEPVVAVFVDDSCAVASSPARLNLARYEEAFAHMPLTYRMYTTLKPPPGTLLSIDGRQPYSEPKFQSEGGNLPDELKHRMPLAISKDYGASYLISDDRRTLLAYLCNAANHTTEVFISWIGGSHHRSPQPADFRVRIQNLPATSLRYRLYDLNEKKICREVVDRQAPEWALGFTDHDYFLLVTPE
jgi:hypothetical protein